MSILGLTIRHLAYTGPKAKTAQLAFEPGLNLLYGASNTGKSFSLKTIDFMLGGTSLPGIPESNSYNKLWLGFSLQGKGDFTLSRSVSGGNFELYNGLIISADPSTKIKTLPPTQQTKSEQSLPHYLLEQLGFAQKILAKNADGLTDPISFRDIAAISLVNETSIQSEQSPIESGQVVTRTKERSLFRLLLTGLDDSGITPVIDEKTFNTSKAVKIEVMEDMIKTIEDKLSCYPDTNELYAQYERLTESLEKIQSEFNTVQGSIRTLVQEKQSLSIEIPKVGQRIEEIQIHIERFNQLENIYSSDIERLEALEEAGFLMSLTEKKECTLCGASVDAQNHTHDSSKIERIQQAALVEIAKIKNQRKDLKLAIFDLENEANTLAYQYPLLIERLNEVELDIARLAPASNDNKHIINEIISTRDHTKEGLSLLDQKNNLIAMRDEFSNLKKPSKDDKPNLKTPDSTVHQFCTIVSNVLKAWDYPGDCIVSFNEKSYDLMIDGKLRINNGKGVRAVTHAAFKVALLIFCRQQGLPHPGFIVLDTPLLTYRDPIKNAKAGNLTEDEKLIAKSSLKKKFFEHLSSIKHLGQFIILENIDPPEGIEKIAHVQTFYGNNEGSRNGLFPT